MSKPMLKHQGRSRVNQLLSACMLTLVAGSAEASPSGGEVVAGSATIGYGVQATLIEQSSSRVVIDWRRFDIAADESVRFVQPDSRSATLNRVTGDQLSLILGRLDANGQIYLMNPNGIVFGNGAQVNVGGLIASTANIDTGDFMEERLEFKYAGNEGASITNSGTITASEGGLVALVAPQVRNDGIITARLGRVALAAGDTFTIDLYGDQLINFAVNEGSVGRIVHSGVIDTAGGETVLLTAATGKTVVDEVINLSGVVRAESVEQHNGKIVLLGSGGSVNVSGELYAQGSSAGERGGVIEVLGDQVQLAEGAVLDASGHDGGGTIHVGGGYQGGDRYRASATRVEQGVSLAADGGQMGDGGEVVVWSDGTTDYAGTISARGGTEGGDGGRVEVSGKGVLSFDGTVDAGADNGSGGTLLLDPTNLSVDTATAANINTILRTGTSTTLAASVDISINSTIDGRGGLVGGGLTMNAGNTININSNVITNGGAITLNATAGDITMASGTGLYSLGGAIATTAGSGMTAGDIYAEGGNITLGGGSGTLALNGNLVSNGSSRVDVSTTSGSITAASGSGVYSGSGGISLKAGSSGTATSLTTGTLYATGGGITLVGGSGGMNLNGSAVSGGTAISATSGGSLTMASGTGLYGSTIGLTANGDIQAQSLDASSTLQLTSTAGGVTLNGQADGSSGITVNANNNVLINNTLNSINSAISVTSANGTVGTSSGSPATTGLLVTDGAGGVGSGAITVSGSGNVDTQLLATQGSVSVTSTAGNITIGQTPDDRNASLTLNANQTLDLNGNRLKSQGALSLTSGNTLQIPLVGGGNNDLEGDTVTVVSGGGISGTGTGSHIYANSSVSLTANGGDIGNLWIYTPSANVTASGDIGAYSDDDNWDNDIIVNLSGLDANLDGNPDGNATLNSTGGSIALSAAGFNQVNATANQDIKVWGNFTALGDSTLNAGHDILFYRAKGGTITATAGHDILFPWEQSGGVPLPAPTTGDSYLKAYLYVTNLNLQATNDITFNRSIMVYDALAATATNGNITSGARGTVQVGGGLTTASDSAQFTATNGSINLSGALSGLYGPFTLSAPSASGSVTFGNLVKITSGALGVTAGSSIRVNDQVETVGSGGTVAMTAPTIYLGDSIFTENQAITLNGNVLISPSTSAYEIISQGGTFLDGNNDGFPDDTTPADSVPDSYTPIETSMRLIRIASGALPLERTIGPTIPAGANITIAGTIGLDPTYMGHASLLLEAGMSGITLNGSLTGVAQGTGALQSDNRSLQFGAAADTLTLGGGVALTPNRTLYFDSDGIHPDTVCAPFCLSTGSRWLAVDNDTFTGTTRVADFENGPTNFYYDPTNEVEFITVTPLGYSALVQKWNIANGTDYPRVDKDNSGNGTPVHALPEYLLSAVGFDPLTLLWTNYSPFTLAPSPNSVANTPPSALTTLAVSAPIPSLGSGSGEGSTTSDPIEVGGTTIPIGGGDGEDEGDQQSLLLALLENGIMVDNPLLFAGGRGEALYADVGRGGDALIGGGAFDDDDDDEDE